MNCGIKVDIVSIYEGNSKGYVGLERNTVTDWLAATNRDWRRALAVQELSAAR